MARIQRYHRLRGSVNASGLLTRASAPRTGSFGRRRPTWSA